MVTKKTFDKVFDHWSAVNNELGYESQQYISEQLDAADGHRIELHEDYPVCVECENHCFSNVCAVVKKNDHIYLETEDCGECSIEHRSSIAKYHIASAIEYVLEYTY